MPGGLGQEDARPSARLRQVTELWGFHLNLPAFLGEPTDGSDPPTRALRHHRILQKDAKPPVPAAGVLCSTVKGVCRS